MNATETATLGARDRVVGDMLGNSVLMVGNTALLGAPCYTFSGAPNPGAVYAYVEPASGWKTTSGFQRKFVSSDGANTDNFGSSIAMSGSTLVIGALQDHWVGLGTPGPGATYIFGR